MEGETLKKFLGRLWFVLDCIVCEIADSKVTMPKKSRGDAYKIVEYYVNKYYEKYRTDPDKLLIYSLYALTLFQLSGGNGLPLRTYVLAVSDGLNDNTYISESAFIEIAISAKGEPANLERRAFSMTKVFRRFEALGNKHPSEQKQLEIVREEFDWCRKQQ